MLKKYERFQSGNYKDSIGTFFFPGCMDLKKSGPGPDTKSKHGPERGQYLTDFGANRKLFNVAKIIKIR